MKESFVKNIQGHQLEFNKLGSLGCYNVSPKNLEYTSVLSLKKDDKGMWNANEMQQLPAWFNEISMSIHCAIEENETKETNNSDFLQFAYQF